METITPRVDIAFKKIFGIEENKDLLMSLINSVVSEEDQVSDISLLNPYNSKNFMGDKLSILDIKAKGSDDQYFNIEIQVTDEGDYDKRALYYWAKLYTEQLKEADSYRVLSKVIGIHILNFSSIPDSKKYHHVFQMRDKESQIHYFRNIELHTIELKKFEESFTAKDGVWSKVKTSLEMWVAFLTRHDLLDREHFPTQLDSADQQNLKKALQVIQVMNFSSEERGVYEDRLRWYRMEEGALLKAKAEGKAEGIAEGKAEEKRALARALMKKKMEIDFIQKVTGLTEEEISKLT
jgi:predicted transposase/invertase (TIGR01784 family)